MNEKKDYKGVLNPDEDCLTKLGIFIIKTSLDEISQLINVTKVSFAAIESLKEGSLVTIE